ncbi:MAG: ATP-binding protein [Bacteroidetes bacterium]|nr:ATP-binding protein [Bacteroidota bacterium]
MEKIAAFKGKIAFTGPECSGKTTLALWLSEHLSLPLVEEQARNYLAGKCSYSWEDVQNIGQRQFEMNQTALNCICDTEMTVIRIWEKVRYGSISNTTEELSAKDSYTLLFLCQPDFPWESDPLREHPNERASLFSLYQQDLGFRGLKYHVLQGNLEERKSKILTLLNLIS